jgi:hypothetical protein
MELQPISNYKLKPRFAMKKYCGGRLEDYDSDARVMQAASQMTIFPEPEEPFQTADEFRQFLITKLTDPGTWEFFDEEEDPHDPGRTDHFFECTIFEGMDVTVSEKNGVIDRIMF